ncbi:MAG: PAS domain-containing protein [Sideroxydans sp.]|nr:PAS domain-containing protein [Sideroxydans sp.]
MAAKCEVCGSEITAEHRQQHGITDGICAACALRGAHDKSLLESIGAPVLLMQGNPRQVITVNKRALELFGKKLFEVEDKRGGQVFDCLHSFSEAGCGKDINCEHCKIKEAIVDTFNTGAPHSGVSSPLQIKKASGISTYQLQVSTEKVGDLALVRVERYDRA